MQTNSKLVPLLCFTIFFSVINGTMFNIAIPNISQQFDLLPSQVSWVVTGFILLFALSSVIFGKLADLYPVKYLITIGLILFNIGSLLGFLSQWYPMLLVARYIQACGAGAIPALAMLVATRYFPAEKRGRVMGAIASTVALGSAMGPVIGGFITNALEWNYLFLISLFSLLAIYFYYKWLPVEELKKGSLDIRGALLLVLLIASFLIAVNQFMWQLIPISVVLTYLFVKHIHHIEQPFIQPILFIEPIYRNALISTFLCVGSVFAVMFMVPIMLRDLHQLSSAQIGLVMFPGAMSAAIMGTISGRIADKKGSIPVVYTGMSLLLVGFFLLSALAGYIPLVITVLLIVTYIGFSFIQSSMANTVSRILPTELTGVGMGLYNLTFFLSGAFISAFTGKALDYTWIRIAFNPLSIGGTASMYSNISFLFVLFTATALVLFYRTFQSIHVKQRGYLVKSND